jgi:hypothetical protein
VERSAERRRHEPHDLRVESIDEHDRRAQARHEDVKAADRLLIEEPADVECRGA